LQIAIHEQGTDNHALLADLIVQAPSAKKGNS
jgi:hypothetical protein